MNRPQHVAIIMDGNGRWAKSKGYPRVYGHKAGADNVREITKAAGEIGIKVLTLYAFSTENWKRPETEVAEIMKLLQLYLRNEIKELNKNNVIFRTIGDISKLSTDLKEEIQNVINVTKNNTGLILNIALNYGGRDEIVRAINKLILDEKKHIDEETFEKYLDTSDLPEPDILIRTGGDLRVSNFLLWQIAYSEIITTNVYWPEFDKTQFLDAINEFNTRVRRFGGVND